MEKSTVKQVSKASEKQLEKTVVVVNLFNSEETVSNIATQLDISESTVKTILIKEGIMLRNGEKPISLDTYKPDIIRLKNTGLSVNEIALQLNLSGEFVAKTLNELKKIKLKQIRLEQSQEIREVSLRLAQLG